MSVLSTKGKQEKKKKKRKKSEKIRSHKLITGAIIMAFTGLKNYFMFTYSQYYQPLEIMTAYGANRENTTH